ncbi:hypothetical protein [Amycolatopsis sp. cmx-11-51]|uniref:hypothetical protein n=1 Tax=Amycolatopsis sp. cmx-11-51 TaxID=2785797 RepID=UPI0039E31D58
MTNSASAHDAGPVLRCLSLGAGVQSSAVLLLACEGVIPRFDVALFADTGWEPRAVYANLARLRAHAETFGIPVRTVSAGNIRDDASIRPTGSCRCHCTFSIQTAAVAWRAGNALASTKFRR